MTPHPTATPIPAPSPSPSPAPSPSPPPSPTPSPSPPLPADEPAPSPTPPADEPTPAPVPAPAVPATDPALLARLHARLESAAAGPDAPDVHYRVLDSPVGRLLVAATEAGLVRVAFEREGEEAVLQSLADRVGPRVLRTPARLDPAARWLDAYFAGSAADWTGPLDTRLARGFRLEVVERLRDLRHGETISYAGLAARTSSPNAVRAVGTACATNPLPILIPCHRVTRSDGSIGAYLGGPETKRRLLLLEATGHLPPG